MRTYLLSLSLCVCVCVCVCVPLSPTLPPHYSKISVAFKFAAMKSRAKCVADGMAAHLMLSILLPLSTLFHGMLLPLPV